MSPPSPQRTKMISRSFRVSISTNRVCKWRSKPVQAAVSVFRFSGVRTKIMPYPPYWEGRAISKKLWSCRLKKLKMPNFRKIKLTCTFWSLKQSRRSPRITLSSCRGMSRGWKIQRRCQRRLCTNGCIFRARCGYQVPQWHRRRLYVWARLTLKDSTCSALFVASETAAPVSNASIADAWFHSTSSAQGGPTTSSRLNALTDRATIESSVRSIDLWKLCVRWKRRISRLSRRSRSSARWLIAV